MEHFDLRRVQLDGAEAVDGGGEWPIPTRIRVANLRFEHSQEHSEKNSAAKQDSMVKQFHNRVWSPSERARPKRAGTLHRRSPGSRETTALCEPRRATETAE